MLYIQQPLAQGEELIHIGEFHWMHTFNAFMAILWGALSAIGFLFAAAFAYQQMGQLPAGFPFVESIQYLHPGLRIAAFVIFLMGLYVFAQQMIIKVTTEMAITNRRLVFKRGLLARQVGEMEINRIEGVNVVQSVLGRLLNYGRVMVRGMGVGEVYLPIIDDPIAFRKAIDMAKTAKREEVI